MAWKPDIIYIHGSNAWVSPLTLRKIKRRLGCQVIIWELNQQQLRNCLQAKCMPLYDHAFNLDSYMLPVVRLMGAKQVHHLRACADPQEHFPVELSLEEQQRYGAEVSFIGSPYPERVELLSHLVDYDLKIYGVGWDKVSSDLARCVRPEPVYGLKKTKIFSASRISINLQGSHMLYGENFRVFEVAACGGVSFSTYKPDLVECFEPDTEIVLFEDADDLQQKVDYYLKHPAELDAMAEAGRQRVLTEHTYDQRVERIIECCNL